MRRWVAHQVNRRLIETDSTGQLVRPGGDAQRRWQQADGSDATIIARGDAFDLYIGKSTVYNVTLTTRTATQLGFWLVRWWAFSTWCGLKHKLWYWSLGVLLEGAHESRKTSAALGRARVS